MKPLSVILLLAFIIYPHDEIYSQSCECAGDADGNGVISASDLVDILGSYCSGQEYDSCNDLNMDGEVDIRDVIFFENHWGSNCPAEELPAPLTSTFTGIHVVEYTDFPQELIGSPLGPEPGSKVYRIYAHFSDTEEDVVGLYGYEDSPMIINHTASFYMFQGFEIATPPSSSAGILMGSIPELALRSHFTAGFPEEEFPISDELQIITTCLSGADLNAALSSQNESVSYGEEGFYSGRLLFEPYEELISETEHYELIAQFTTAGDFELQINMASRFYGSGRSIQNSYHEGLIATSNTLDVFGCTDPIATNYNPDATLDLDCEYGGPDLNGDGDVSMGDVLLLLDSFGCSVDCGSADLNGDGLVNAADLTFLLAEL